MADTTQASYEQLAQDAMDGTLPVPKDICKDCTAFGVPFSVNGDNGPRHGDQVLGIPSLPESATEDWLLNNRWIRDKTQNIRDTFLLRVIRRLGADRGVAYLAEFYAFKARQGYEFVCIDDEMVDEKYVAKAQKAGDIQYLHAQIFFDHRGQLNSLVGNGTGIQFNLW